MEIPALKADIFLPHGVCGQISEACHTLSGGAYDSGIDFYIRPDILPCGAPLTRVGSTLELFSNTGKALMDISLTQQDLDGYILSAYAQALPPAGTLNNRMRTCAGPWLELTRIRLTL